MTSKLNHHPSERLLETFCEGLLSTGMSVAISAHLELCDSCRQTADTMKARLAAKWLASEPEPEYRSVPGDASAMLDAITRQPQIVSLTVPRAGDDVGVELHMHERSVKLPRVLAKVAENGVVWRKLAGGINTANLKLDREAQCDFMYMKPGSQAPRHTHGGMEVTLVLDGTFEDELGEYQPGDFVLREGNHTHTPKSDEGCVCYSVLDSPLHFTSGLSRLLNPFQRLLFNRQLRQGA